MGDAAKPDLVPVRIEVGDFACAVFIRLPFGRLESPFGYLGDDGIEVVDENGVHGMSGMLGPMHGIYPPMLRELPHGLDVVREEGWRGAEQPSIPG